MPQELRQCDPYGLKRVSRRRRVQIRGCEYANICMLCMLKARLAPLPHAVPHREGLGRQCVLSIPGSTVSFTYACSAMLPQAFGATESRPRPGQIRSDHDLSQPPTDGRATARPHGAGEFMSTEDKTTRS